MKEEAETLVTHLLVNLVSVFGSDIYQLFSPEHRSQISQFIYCSEAKCVIEAPDDPDDLSIDSTEYNHNHTLSAIADRVGVPNLLENTLLGNTVYVPKFNLTFLISSLLILAWKELALLGTIMGAHVLLELMCQRKRLFLSLLYNKTATNQMKQA